MRTLCLFLVARSLGKSEPLPLDRDLYTAAIVSLVVAWRPCVEGNGYGLLHGDALAGSRARKKLPRVARLPHPRPYLIVAHLE